MGLKIRNTLKFRELANQVDWKVQRNPSKVDELYLSALNQVLVGSVQSSLTVQRRYRSGSHSPSHPGVKTVSTFKASSGRDISSRPPTPPKIPKFPKIDQNS